MLAEEWSRNWPFLTLLYLSSGEVGRSIIFLLAKKAESSDNDSSHSTDCARFKYHASTCYRNFRMDIGLIQPSFREPSLQKPSIDVSQRYCKRFKPRVSFAVQIASQLDRRHTLYGVSEKPTALNKVHVLFRDSVQNGGDISKS